MKALLLGLLGLILSLFTFPLLAQNNGNDLTVPDYYSISFRRIDNIAKVEFNNTIIWDSGDSPKATYLNINIPLSPHFRAGKNTVTIKLYNTKLNHRDNNPWKIEYHIMKNGIISGSVAEQGSSSGSREKEVFRQIHEFNTDVPQGIREIGSGHPNYPFKEISFKGHQTPNETAPCIDKAFATNLFTIPWDGPFYIYMASGPVSSEEVLIEDVNTKGRKYYWSSAKLSSPKPTIRDKSLYVWDAVPTVQDKIRVSASRGNTKYEFHVCKIDKNTYKLRSKNHATRTRLVLYIYKK